MPLPLKKGVGNLLHRGKNNGGRLPTPAIAQSTLKLHEKEHLHLVWQEPALAGYLKV